jgi:radical SAM superfamily enzyme YgiQ (UPF0313 family)
MFAGEAEGRLELMLQDAAAGRLAPLYDFVRNLPAMEGAPVPFLPKPYVEHTLGLSTSFDAGRGCPFQCSFCTIINVQGRKSRFRTADDVEHLVRLNWAQGICKFFIYRRQFRAQQGMGVDLRPSDRAAREGRNPARPDDPG